MREEEPSPNTPPPLEELRASQSPRRGKRSCSRRASHRRASWLPMRESQEQLPSQRRATRKREPSWWSPSSLLSKSSCFFRNQSFTDLTRKGTGGRREPQVPSSSQRTRLLARFGFSSEQNSFNKIIAERGSLANFSQELQKLEEYCMNQKSIDSMVYFLNKFCTLSKSLQMVQQLRLFRVLMNEGIFDVIIQVLQSQDKKLVLIGTDILILFLNQDPILLQSYVVRQEGITLLGFLVKGMITEFGDNMHCQFLEILHSLLDMNVFG
ncbi:hypothetical protein Ahy_A07g037164 isoform A [Arachis hypogaea]|uniref:Serine/threonine-protein phosphatase 4 regulatory subunit 3-like central domain-containing protein n=1 Tax=Arachis hypogaea TaxID=3818 RepID=A0A445CHY4_ARAHY|nr:hypothetical protein Ahy_A07g037164 isoform A [Arachis hypogaea]